MTPPERQEVAFRWPVYASAVIVFALMYAALTARIFGVESPLIFVALAALGAGSGFLDFSKPGRLERYAKPFSDTHPVSLTVGAALVSVSIWGVITAAFGAVIRLL